MITGVQYYRPPTPPPGEHEADLDRIKGMGFDAIRVWLLWGWHEVRSGEFSWEDMDRLFELAEHVGLRVVINLQLEVPPAWFHPSDVLTGPDGEVRRCHFLGTRVPCFDSAETRAAAEPFVREATRRYRKHTALLAWDAWNEPHARNECLCPASRASFSSWLADTYGSIDAFNEFFGKRFTAFDEVPMVGYGNEYGEILNFRLWAAHSVADRLRWAADLIRQEDSDHLITSHAGSCSVVQSMLQATSVCALNARTVDLYGLSMGLGYESSGSGRLCRVAGNKRHVAGLMLDWCRSISAPFWATEVYSNPAGHFRALAPEDLSWQFWLAIASGATGVFLWQFKPERLSTESPGYGLVDLAGKDTDRSRRIAEDIRVLRAHRDLFAALTPVPAEIGILYDERSHCVAEADPELKGLYQGRIQEVYGLLELAGLPVRFVPRQSIRELEGLKLVYLVGPNVMDASLATALQDFVVQGGVLIAEPGLGHRMDNTWVSATIPPCGLDDVFGVQERGMTRAQEPFAFDGARGFPDGSFCRHRVLLDPCKAEVPASFSDGSPAVTRNRCGKGEAFYLAGCPCAEEPRFIGDLLATVGIGPPGEVGIATSPELRWRLGISGDDAVLFFFNTGQATAVVCPRAPILRELRVITGATHDGESVSVPANTVGIVAVPKSAISKEAAGSRQNPGGGQRALAVTFAM